ncbi:hypothetical protein [Roseibium algae]|uniref:Lipoprotein n=1 Tax=Roseibium algae TaxID=3123038 RepID=A0ABU8TIZ6_9HYPH
MTNRSAKLLLAATLICLTGLAGCREAEENRVITLEKGVYAGRPDTKLSEEQRHKLRARGQLQKF